MRRRWDRDYHDSVVVRHTDWIGSCCLMIHTVVVEFRMYVLPVWCMGGTLRYVYSDRYLAYTAAPLLRGS